MSTIVKPSYYPLFADSRTIALSAAKKKFNPEREKQLVEKSKKSKCKCHYNTFTQPCYYRTCRHFQNNHYGAKSDSNKEIIAYNEDYYVAVNLIKNDNITCFCGRKFDISNISQTQWNGSEVDTFAHCPKCKYDLALWKFKNHIGKE